MEVNFQAWYQALDLSYLNDFDASVLSLLVGAVLLAVSADLLLFCFGWSEVSRRKAEQKSHQVYLKQ